MPLIGMDASGEEVPPPKDTPPAKQTGLIYSELPEADWRRVVADVPEKVGLSFIEAGGGAVRALGDLLRSNTIADIGGDVARTAKEASAALTPGEMNLGQQVVSGGLESALQMAPALALGGPAALVAGIGVAAGQQGGSRYSELRDAGFSGGRAGFHAAIDALAEGLGEFVSLPVLTQAARPFLNKLVHFAARDLVGEEFTTVMEQANAMLSDKPNMTWGEFLDGMKMTALVTPVAAGFQTAGAHAAQRIRAAAAPREAAAPDFKTPKPEAPGPTADNTAQVPPPPITSTASDPATILTTEPAKPAASSASPTDIAAMPADQWDAKQGGWGMEYTHKGPNAVVIQKDEDGKWVWSLPGQVADPYGPFKSLEAARDDVMQRGWDKTPEDLAGPGWIRDDTEHLAYPVGGEERFYVHGSPGNWYLSYPGGQGRVRSLETNIYDAVQGSFMNKVALWEVTKGTVTPAITDTMEQAGLHKAKDSPSLWEHPTNGWSIQVEPGLSSTEPYFNVLNQKGELQANYSSPHEAIAALEHGAKGAPASSASVVQKPQADLLKHTPDEMIAMGAYDPRVYNGSQTKVTQNDILVYSSPAGWAVRVVGPDGASGPGTVFGSQARAIDRLTELTGTDIRKDHTQLRRLYSEAVFSEIGSNPDSSPVSQSVADYFGAQNLEDIRQGAAMQKGNLGFRAVPADQGAFAHSLVPRNLPKLELRSTDGKVFQATTQEEIDALPPGVYVESDFMHGGGVTFKTDINRVHAFLGVLQRKYLPTVKIVLMSRGPMDFLGKASTGGSGVIGKNAYAIGIDGLTTPTKPVSERQAMMVTAAHEFGHVVMFHAFYEASPRVQAKLLASYYNHVKQVRGDKSLREYMLEHNFDPRDSENKTIDSQYALIGSGVSYLMSPSEYFADQASAYFTYHDGVQFPDPEVRGFFQGLIARLQSLWKQLNVTFKQNTTFTDWLDTLAGGEQKASASGYPTPGPGPQPGAIAALPNIVGTTITSEQQAMKLAKMASDFAAAAYDAGVPIEEVKALSPTGLIGDINWKAMEALGDKYGIPKGFWKGSFGRYSPNQTDDTTGFRESIFRMSRKLGGDSDFKAEIGKTNSAIKGFNWLLQRTMTAVQLRKRFGAIVPGVKSFVDNLEKMFAYRSRWKERSDNTIKEMRSVGHQERTRVFNLLLDEDKSGEFASKLDRDVTGKRTFTLTEEAIKKYHLTEKGVSLYTAIRSDFDAALEELEFQADAELRRLYSESEALNKALAELHDGFAQIKSRPYVPHTRFGDHTVTVRTPEGVVREFYQFESSREAKKEEARLRAEYGKSAVVSRGKMTELQKIMAGLPPQLVNSMKAQLNLNPEQIGKFEDILKEMSHGAAFVRRFKRRKNIEGWADDAEQFPRAYADYMSRFANHVSRLKYNHVLSSATASVRAQATEESKIGLNTVELNDLATWLGRLQDYINQPGTEYANARAAATIWYLGLNVKSALVNSTSVPMVTLPYLSKRFGWARAFEAVTQAYKDIARQYTRLGALSPDERKMIQSLREAGRIDASFASELAGLREGGRLSDQTALSRPAAWLFGTKYWGMWLFQKMEVINREVTALAAYRLHRTNKNFAADDPHGFDQKAAEQASLSIQDTQNENAQWNRSEFMRGRKSVLTMFMSYQQNIIYQMLGGDESAMRLLATQLVMAGMLGIPFAQDIDDLIKWFARKVFGSDINVEKAVRAVLKDTMVDADWFLKGASHNLGGLDLSGSLSQGRVIPGVQALTMEGNFADSLANAAGDVGGAGFSIIMNAMKVASSNDPNTWKKWGRAMPEFARSMVEGGEMLSGTARDARGNKVADTSTGDAFMRSLGFQISDVASERDKRFAQRDTAQYWLTRRAYVMTLWEKSVEDRGGEWRAKAQEALREFNSEAPDRALRITAQQLRESMMRRSTSQARVERNLGPTKTVQQTYQRVGSLYE